MGIVPEGMCAERGWVLKMRIEDVIGSHCKKCNSPIQIVELPDNMFMGICSNLKCLLIVRKNE